ncbi:MAG: hypothetical protein OEZ58_20735, partial [Gammaproteobacteria bacterium]|nr:hypothetical protein [Gammaproteobacteria bacterium]
QTFCAYTFHNPRRENMEALISILSAIIEFALDSRPTDIRFLLLWTENILLALNAAYSNCRMSVDVQAQYIKLRNELSLADFVMCSSYIPQLLRNAC